MKPPFHCLWCEEMVEPGDLMHALLPSYHYACALRTTLGSISHVHRTCSCYVKEHLAAGDGDGTAEDDPPGLTRRQAARLVADYVRHQQAPQPGRN